MKIALTVIGTALLLSACATTQTHSPSTQQAQSQKQCQHLYPKPNVRHGDLNSPEYVEWVNQMLACQHGKR